jgi:hypothetical protein
MEQGIRLEAAARTEAHKHLARLIRKRIPYSVIEAALKEKG